MLLSPLQLAIIFLVTVTASSISGMVVFGVGMVLTPSLLLLMEPRDVVVVINGVALPLFALISFQTRRQFYPSIGLPLGLAGLAGVPIGTLLLSSAGSPILRIAIASVTLAISTLLAFRVHVRVPWPRVTGPLVVWTAAVSLSGLAVGGPLIMLFAVAQMWPRDMIRSITSFCILAIMVGMAVSYGVVGLFTLDRLALILFLLPSMYLGFRLGSYVVHRANDLVFHYLAVFVMALVSIVVLARELL